MKEKDFALILIIAFVSGIFSFVLSNFLFASPKNRQEKVEIVQPITADFKPPTDKYFNEQSVDPTQLITIGNDANNTPFKAN